MRHLAGGVAVVPTAPEYLRNGDVHHDFRPDSDFFYLTGFPEAEAVAVIAPSHPRHAFVLFVRPRDKAAETWNGRRAGVQGARRRFGADAAFPIAKIDTILPKYLAGASRVLAPWGRYEAFDRRLADWMKRSGGRQSQFERCDITSVLHEMRLVKTPPEVERMRRAAEITRDAHVAAMRAARPGVTEAEIDGILRFHFRAGGAERMAYNPIVGSGANATILHYVENCRRMEDGDLLLIDAGAEYGGYACDVTRTFPVNGRFTPAQRAVYDVVLAAQKASIDECRPGVPQSRPHETSIRILTEGMVRLGLLKGNVKSLIKSAAFRRFYMHGTGHWLGMDVHDVGRYRLEKNTAKARLLAPGMVTTIEPGLYVEDKAKGVDPSFWGIGVRIEDDILVSSSEPVNLTWDIPKEPDEIESIVGTSRGGFIQ